MPWCDFGEKVKEVRQLKCGDSNLLLCYKHYLEEIEFRKDANKHLDVENRFDLPTWESLEIVDN
jgi:hypothetical protein